MLKVLTLSCCRFDCPQARREAIGKDTRAFAYVKCIYSLCILQLLGEKQLHDSSFHILGSLDIIQPANSLQ